jgi:hypothetical protein
VTLYRLIFVDPHAGITGTAKIHCDTDEQAITEARSRAADRGVVILQDDRCVDAIEGSDS